MAEERKEGAATEEKASLTGRLKGAFRQYAVMAAVSALLCASFLFIYDKFFALKIATLDVKGYVSEQRELYFSGKINDEQLHENIERLRAIVRSQPKNVVILTEDVVVKEQSLVKEKKH